jgi:hypothetical protein
MGDKKRLLIVAGSGATVEFSMPSVDGVHDILLRSALNDFSLSSERGTSLYGHLYDEIARYWALNLPIGQHRKPNYEDALYALYELSAAHPAGVYTGPLGAFVGIRHLPDVIYSGKQTQVSESILAHMGRHLVDTLVDDLRRRCTAEQVGRGELRGFLSNLREKFDISVATTNYDNLLHQALPGIETGFDRDDDGRFKPMRLLKRSSWQCFLHLHGSVHFDMDLDQGDIHAIHWRDDLTEPFHPNAWGRTSYKTREGMSFPTSGIIAGYGKPAQLQRFPFRIYYSELDRLICDSDAVLFLGYGFGDLHLNLAFSGFRDGRDRRVVVIDYADDHVLNACAGFGDGPRQSMRALGIFQTHPSKMWSLGCNIPDRVGPIKEARDFERSIDASFPLAIWYGGMLQACKYSDKIAAELSGG